MVKPLRKMAIRFSDFRKRSSNIFLFITPILSILIFNQAYPCLKEHANDCRILNQNSNFPGLGKFSVKRMNANGTSL